MLTYLFDEVRLFVKEKTKQNHVKSVGVKDSYWLFL